MCSFVEIIQIFESSSCNQLHVVKGLKQKDYLVTRSRAWGEKKQTIHLINNVRLIQRPFLKSYSTFYLAKTVEFLKSEFSMACFDLVKLNTKLFAQIWLFIHKADRMSKQRNVQFPVLP